MFYGLNPVVNQTNTLEIGGHLQATVEVNEKKYTVNSYNKTNTVKIIWIAPKQILKKSLMIDQIYFRKVLHNCLNLLGALFFFSFLFFF